jgi:hypothetical protein
MDAQTIRGCAMTTQMNSPFAKFVFAGACALVAAAAIYVWSQSAPMVAEAATTTAMSPTEMTINYNRPLPVENWEPAY